MLCILVALSYWNNRIEIGKFGGEGINCTKVMRRSQAIIS